MTDPALLDRWFPVLRAPEAAKRHVARGQLLGEELALWRDDAGHVNVWANQCPHRGVRLSIGSNFGDRLKCRYHGWEFTSGTAQCVAIPAHPDLVPGKQYRARAFAAAEKYGYVWVNLGTGAGAPSVPALDSGPFVTLRSIIIRATAAQVAERLLSEAAFAGTRAIDEFTLDARIDEAGVPTVMLLQPLDAEVTALHAAAGPAASLRLCDQILGELRAGLEARR